MSSAFTGILARGTDISGVRARPAGPRPGGGRLTDASVYFDHPVHAQAEHTLNIDFLDSGAGPSARVAVELTAKSARALAKAIQASLDAAPPGPGVLRRLCVYLMNVVTSAPFGIR